MKKILLTTILISILFSQNKFEYHEITVPDRNGWALKIANVYAQDGWEVINVESVIGTTSSFKNFSKTFDNGKNIYGKSRKTHSKRFFLKRVCDENCGDKRFFGKGPQVEYDLDTYYRILSEKSIEYLFLSAEEKEKINVYGSEEDKKFDAWKEKYEYLWDLN